MAWAVWRFDRLDARGRATLLLVISGLVINALICVVFSGIAGRYQARVIWLLPLFILSLLAATDRQARNRSLQGRFSLQGSAGFRPDLHQ
jgi:hypothetical protein